VKNIIIKMSEFELQNSSSNSGEEAVVTANLNPNNNFLDDYTCGQDLSTQDDPVATKLPYVHSASSMDSATFGNVIQETDAVSYALKTSRGIIDTYQPTTSSAIDSNSSLSIVGSGCLNQECRSSSVGSYTLQTDLRSTAQSRDLTLKDVVTLQEAVLYSREQKVPSASHQEVCLSRECDDLLHDSSFEVEKLNTQSSGFGDIGIQAIDPHTQVRNEMPKQDISTSQRVMTNAMNLNRVVTDEGHVRQLQSRQDVASGNRSTQIASHVETNNGSQRIPFESMWGYPSGSITDAHITNSLDVETEFKRPPSHTGSSTDTCRNLQQLRDSEASGNTNAQAKKNISNGAGMFMQQDSLVCKESVAGSDAPFIVHDDSQPLPLVIKKSTPVVRELAQHIRRTHRIQRPMDEATAQPNRQRQSPGHAGRESQARVKDNGNGHLLYTTNDGAISDFSFRSLAGDSRQSIVYNPSTLNDHFTLNQHSAGSAINRSFMAESAVNRSVMLEAYNVERPMSQQQQQRQQLILQQIRHIESGSIEKLLNTLPRQDSIDPTNRGAHAPLIRYARDERSPEPHPTKSMRYSSPQRPVGTMQSQPTSLIVSSPPHYSNLYVDETCATGPANSHQEALLPSARQQYEDHMFNELSGRGREYNTGRSQIHNERTDFPSSHQGLLKDQKLSGPFGGSRESFERNVVTEQGSSSRRTMMRLQTPPQGQLHRPFASHILSPQQPAIHKDYEAHSTAPHQTMGHHLQQVDRLNGNNNPAMQRGGNPNTSLLSSFVNRQSSYNDGSLPNTVNASSYRRPPLNPQDFGVISSAHANTDSAPSNSNSRQIGHAATWPSQQQLVQKSSGALAQRRCEESQGTRRGMQQNSFQPTNLIVIDDTVVSIRPSQTAVFSTFAA